MIAKIGQVGSIPVSEIPETTARGPQGKYAAVWSKVQASPFDRAITYKPLDDLDKARCVSSVTGHYSKKYGHPNGFRVSYTTGLDGTVYFRKVSVK